MRVTYDFDEELSNTLDIDGLQDVWEEFGRLMKAMSAHPSSESYIKPAQFHDDARKWAKQFRDVTFDEDVIPYIHGKLIIYFFYLLCN